MCSTGSTIQQQYSGSGIVAKPLGPYLEFFAKAFNLNKFYIAGLYARILLGKIILRVNSWLVSLLARKENC
jgi:hypothetical protein